MRYMLAQQLYVASRRRSSLQVDGAWTLDAPGALSGLMDYLGEFGERRDENRVKYHLIGIIQRDDYGVVCMTDWTGNPIRTATLERDLQRRARPWLKDLKIEGHEVRVIPSDSPDAPADYVYQEYYAPDEITWSSLFEDKRPREVWSRLIIPFLLIRRWLISSMAYRPQSAQAAELAGSPRGSRIREVFSHDDDEALVWMPSDNDCFAITIGDVYPFGRLTALSLAETAAFLIVAGRFGDQAKSDFTLADPVQAFGSYYKRPAEVPVELADGRVLSGDQLAAGLTSFMVSYLNQVLDVPGIADIVHTVVGSSHRFLSGRA